jgi:hypothetical protein
VIGVVVAKLDAIKVAEAIQDIPQNVNFAIKATVLINFLDANGVSYSTGNWGQAMASADLAERGKSISVPVLCERWGPLPRSGSQTLPLGAHAGARRALHRAKRPELG